MILDAYGRALKDLRVSLTDRCNFRCPYCMPAHVYGNRYNFLPKPQILTYEEIDRIVRVFVRSGVRKIRLTGGEPLVRPDVHKLVAALSSIDGIDDLTLTTNGYFLEEQAYLLKSAGLNRVTVSLDSLDPEISRVMNGRELSPSRVLNGIDAAHAVGLAPIKINCVVIRGINDEHVIDLVRYFKGTPHIIRFIEYMDVGNLNGWNRNEVVPSDELIGKINKIFPIEPVGANYDGEVVTRYRYSDNSGELGFISSVTQPFCGACTRARLSPEGELITCLFANRGVDLKKPLRDGASDEEIEQIVNSIWNRRTDRYSELRGSSELVGSQKIEMYHIGG